MKNIFTLFLLVSCFAVAQNPAPKSQPVAQPDVSGMYAFLKEGEFVEVDVDSEQVTGLISRIAETDSDRGAVLDHMLTKGSFDGKNLAFTTRELHGVSYEFKGTVGRGDGKQPGSEGYWVLKGTLTENTVAANKIPTARAREVEFKSLPSDAQPTAAKKD